MRIRKIKNRGVLFTHSNPGWDLNVYINTLKQYQELDFDISGHNTILKKEVIGKILGSI